MTNKLPPVPSPFYAGFIRAYEDSYSLSQMKEYGQQCREAALEEAAKVCDSTWNGDSDTVDASAAYNECADAIRSLK